MSEEVRTSATESLVLSGPDERNGMYAGTVVLVLAIVAIAISIYQSGITAPVFGPTLAPRLMALGMIAMGVALITDKVKVRNPQDFYGGIALIGLAIVALLASANLAGMHTVALIRTGEHKRFSRGGADLLGHSVFLPRIFRFSFARS